MNVVVFGASRGIGRCVVEHALLHGHRVTAAVRDPGALPLRHKRLRVLACDVLDPGAVERALVQQHVAFCTLGADGRGPTTLYSRGAKTIAHAMQAQGVRRLIHLSNFGVLGERARDLRTAGLLFIARQVLRHVLADHRRALEEIQRRVPEWVAVRPLPLIDGVWTGRYRVALDGLPRRAMRIARADVADFMLQQVSSAEFLNTVPAIAY
jgi:putative NADH-flavin reductase